MYSNEFCSLHNAEDIRIRTRKEQNRIFTWKGKRSDKKDGIHRI